MSYHMGVVPAHSRTFFGYVPETAKTASRDGGGKGSAVGYLGALACAEHDARGGKSQSAADPSAFCAKISANLKVQCARTAY
jgi:hypothetical protein